MHLKMRMTKNQPKVSDTKTKLDVRPLNLEKLSLDVRKIFTNNHLNIYHNPY